MLSSIRQELASQRQGDGAFMSLGDKYWVDHAAAPMISLIGPISPGADGDI